MEFIKGCFCRNKCKYISKKIPVQEAKPEQIILIEVRFKKKGNNYVDFNDIIYAFSERNIFGDDGKINYSNYNTFVYDYDRIEEELGKIILPGLHLFLDEINFVTYWGEAFRGKKSDIIIKFYEKYPQIDLNTNEKQKVINYIFIYNKKINSRYFKNIYDSIIILLFHLTKQKTEKEDALICDIIKNVSKQLNLSNDFENFLCNVGKDFTLKNFMNLFFFFEHLCFKDLSNTLQPDYKATIPEEIKNKIKEKLLKEKNSSDIINSKNLASATRRFISRYLVGGLMTIDIKEDRDLAFELSRMELWEEKIGKMDNLLELIMEKINEFRLTVGQAFEFYNIICEEDRNSLKIENNQ